jgi:hypothetical protein
MKIFAISPLVLAVVAGLGGLGCGSSKEPSAQVTGLASSESAATSVSLKDSASPSNLRTTIPDASGNFAIDATGLTAPFFLKAETASGPEYAIALFFGRTDVNPVTTAACAGASKDEDDEDGEEGWSGRDHDSRDRIEGILASLRRVLKPLFDLYGIKRIGGDDDDHKGANLRALLRDVSFTVKKGVVTVTNRETSAVIFTGALRRLSEGTFFPENMPAGPGGGATCTSFTYSDFGTCQADGTQTRTVLTSTPAGCTGGAPVLSQSCTYVPPTNVCTTFTYSDFGACQPDNTQTRTVLTSSPTGCTGGSPVLTQACTYVPPVNTCTSFTYSAFAACQPDNTQTRTVLTSSPTGCTGGTPVLTQACIFVPPVTCTLATAVASCSTCHGTPGTGSHANRSLACATCHGPVNNGSGTPSTGMGAVLSGTNCTLSYPTSGTHDDGAVNFGAAQ